MTEKVKTTIGCYFLFEPKLFYNSVFFWEPGFKSAISIGPKNWESDCILTIIKSETVFMTYCHHTVFYFSMTVVACYLSSFRGCCLYSCCRCCWLILASKCWWLMLKTISIRNKFSMWSVVTDSIHWKIINIMKKVTNKMILPPPLWWHHLETQSSKNFHHNRGRSRSQLGTKPTFKPIFLLF